MADICLSVSACAVADICLSVSACAVVIDGAGTCAIKGAHGTAEVKKMPRHYNPAMGMYITACRWRLGYQRIPCIE